MVWRAAPRSARVEAVSAVFLLANAVAPTLAAFNEPVMRAAGQEQHDDKGEPSHAQYPLLVGYIPRGRQAGSLKRGTSSPASQSARL